MPKVLHISDAASLALHTTVFLAASPEEPVAVGHIAATLGASEAHLSKVLQRLAKAGIVHSSRGPGGGFTLARPGDGITLMQVYEAIEGEFSMNECLLNTRVCKGDCILGGLVCQINNEVRQYLVSHRLTDLVKVYDSPGKATEKAQPQKAASKIPKSKHSAKLHPDK